MTRFEIRDDFFISMENHLRFYLAPFIILGFLQKIGIIRSITLKALGFNTGRGLMCLNLHEPREGEFHFEELWIWSDFFQTAQDLGLYAIVRPSPFICAEWEFGGLPTAFNQRYEASFLRSCLY